MKEAAELSRGEDFDALSLIGEHYPQLRRYAPTLIETLQFRPAPVARGLIEAVEVLREMNRDGLRKVPQNAPLGFIRRRWESYVVGPEGIDRRFYELCVMAELKNSLRSGDVRRHVRENTALDAVKVDHLLEARIRTKAY